MKHILAALISFFFLPPGLSAQSVQVVTTDHLEYRGDLIRDGDTLVVRNDAGVEFLIPRTAVHSISFPENRMTVRPDASDARQRSGLALGAGVGTPGMVNLIAGWNFNDRWGIRGSGLYWDGWAAGQLDLTYRALQSGQFSHSVYVGTGAIPTYTNGYPITPDYLLYGIVGYDLEWKGFHLIPGLAYGQGEIDHGLYPFGQLAWIFDFR